MMATPSTNFCFVKLEITPETLAIGQGTKSSYHIRDLPRNSSHWPRHKKLVPITSEITSDCSIKASLLPLANATQLHILTIMGVSEGTVAIRSESVTGRVRQKRCRAEPVTVRVTVTVTVTVGQKRRRARQKRQRVEPVLPEPIQLQPEPDLKPQLVLPELDLSLGPPVHKHRPVLIDFFNPQLVPPEAGLDLSLAAPVREEQASSVAENQLPRSTI
ncbi:hypothetical protein E2542_SST13965 [Spatholobus suberectus]|nr:hypothetical protein E2542_SST13965 [Spatholobus suberectus]